MNRALVFSISVLVFPAALVSAAGFAEPVLNKILSDQRVADVESLDCLKVDHKEAAVLGEAYFSDQIGTQDLGKLTEIPEETRNEIFGNIGLTLLGCMEGGVPIPIPEGVDPSEISASAEAQAQMSTRQSRPGFTNIGFLAAWTTLLWMFSAIGFGVFMVWITSSKFRLQFRKMAEGDFEDNGKAMDVLKERYARGEITKEQYDKMRRDIVY